MNHNGPWRKAQYDDVYPGYNDDENDILDAKGRLVATVTEWEDEGTPNACLVEAAPELLEALENLVRWHDTGTNPPIASDWSKARAAIEKAKGGPA